MKIKLYVDDQRESPVGWHLAKTITEAIRILSTMEVEEVSLDHDIGKLSEDDFKEALNNCSINPSNELVDSLMRIQNTLPKETFEPVARYIASMPKEIRPWVNIHSGNPFAYDRYRDILADQFTRDAK